jgi:hypothetical protein
MFGKKKESDGVFKSVLIASFILTLHILLIAIIATLVLFFRGVVNYILWILIGGLGLIILSGLYFIRRLRAEGRSLRDALNNPMFNGRSVEVSLLGGAATVRLGKPSRLLPLDSDAAINMPRLESPDAAHHREVAELAELARLLEKDLITIDEFNKAKQLLLDK